MIEAIKNIDIPKEVKDVSRALSLAGYQNYLVGGCVRDIILNKSPKDWDITTNANPEEIISLFPHTFYENSFGTVGIVNDNTPNETLRTIEVTPYRLEAEYSDFRHPNKVKWANNIEDDLARRDFTMNAIALSLDEAGKITDVVDPFNGINDIKDKLIRAVGNPTKRFQEDALRSLRAVRFVGELNFAIELDTQSAIIENSHLVENISKERVRDEFIKIIMSENPGISLDLLARLKLLKFISNELEKGIGVEQNKAHAYTVWEHLLRSLNHASKKGFPLHVRLASLFHDIAKPHTKHIKNGQITFYGHEVVGAKISKKIMNDLRFPKEITEKVYKLVRWHMFFSDTEQITHSAVRRIIKNVGTDLIWDLMDTRTADRIGTGRPKESPYRLRKYYAMIEEVMRDPISVKQLKVKGGDVMKITGTNGGPHIGYILEILLSEVLQNPELNTSEYLNNRVKALYDLPGDELIKRGIKARRQNEGEEEKEVEKIRGEYGVK